MPNDLTTLTAEQLAERAARAMGETTKCCGTCRWWDRPPPPYTNGNCLYPLPACIDNSIEYGMNCEWGTECKCWAATDPKPENERGE